MRQPAVNMTEKRNTAPSIAAVAQASAANTAAGHEGLPERRFFVVKVIFSMRALYTNVFYFSSFRGDFGHFRVKKRHIFFI